MHHASEFSNEFAKFKKLGYKWLEEIWDLDLVYWSYFEILGKLIELGYPVVESFWYYDDMEVNDIVLLKMIRELEGYTHSYN